MDRHERTNTTIFHEQEKFSSKDRIYTVAIFNETFLEFIDNAMKELQEKNDPKDKEICTNLMRELNESIQHLKEEHVDVRVQMMVFAKALATVIMDTTSLVFRNK